MASARSHRYKRVEGRSHRAIARSDRNLAIGANRLSPIARFHTLRYQLTLVGSRLSCGKGDIYAGSADFDMHACNYHRCIVAGIMMH